MVFLLSLLLTLTPVPTGSIRVITRGIYRSLAHIQNHYFTILLLSSCLLVDVFFPL